MHLAIELVQDRHQAINGETLELCSPNTGKIGSGKVAILPVAMIGLSCHGVISDFGVAPAVVASWVAGVAIAAGLGVMLATPRGVAYSTEDRAYSVPGSWIPLTLMMAIFFTKYAVAVILALKLPFARAPVFVDAVSLCYGLLSGLFIGRAIVIWRSRERGIHTAPDPSVNTDARAG